MSRSDVLAQCASNLGLSVPELMTKIVEERNFSNASEIVRQNLDRYNRGIDLPVYVENWCLNRLRERWSFAEAEGQALLNEDWR